MSQDMVTDWAIVVGNLMEQNERLQSAIDLIREYRGYDEDALTSWRIRSQQQEEQIADLTRERDQLQAELERVRMGRDAAVIAYRAAVMPEEKKVATLHNNGEYRVTRFAELDALIGPKRPGLGRPRKSRDSPAPRPPKAKRICSLCERRYRAKGLCSKCYLRWWRAAH